MKSHQNTYFIADFVGRTVRKPALLIVVLQLCFGLGSTAIAQRAGVGDKQEYIQSMTVLDNGLAVTRTTLPGQEPQTVVGYGTTMQSVSAGAGRTQTVFEGQFLPVQQRYAQHGLLNQQTNFPTYQQPSLPPPGQTLSQSNATPFATVDANFANQIPTLGLPGNYVTPPTRNPHCFGRATTLFSPGPLVGSDFSTGSGQAVVQPVLPIQNLPPGTYVGRGLLGQPTAYVDGQPMRNLLRFLIYP